MSVNATESGTVTELLAKEEDTVTVGQDLVKLEPGAAPEGKKEESAEKPKEPETPKESQPSESEKQPAQEEKKPQPPQQPPAPKPEPPKPQAEAPKAEPTADAKPTLGTREERKVGHPLSLFYIGASPMFCVDLLTVDFVDLGENEQNAPEDRGAPEAIPEHGRFAHYL